MIILIWGLSASKKSTSSFSFSSRYCKDIVKFMFWILWPRLALHNQSDTINLLETFVFICRQKSTSSTKLFWRYCQDTQTSYFGYFGHAWLHKPKMIVSTCRRPQCLSACQKINFIIHFFLEILHFKEFCNLIGWRHFGP